MTSVKRLFNCVRKVLDNSDDDQLNEQVDSTSIIQPEDVSCDFLFIKIPSEICLHIFGYLSPRDLCKISLVCQSFKKLADDNQIWKLKCPKSIISSISKPYKQIYNEWRKQLADRKHELFQMQKNRIQANLNTYRSLQRREDGYMRRYETRSGGCLLHFHQHESMNQSSDIFSHRWGETRCVFSTHGFIGHPSSSQDLTITLSVDIDQIISALYALLTKASSFKQQYQQSVILKQMIQRYDRFMQLKASQPSDTHLIPTLDIEIVWQTHLLRPEIYRNDCERLFGHIIDHSLIIKNHIKEFHKQQVFINTCQLYEEKFGEKYCSLPSIDHYNDVISSYPYWDETFFEFSLDSPKNYENRFSFTENDIILDLNWFDLWKRSKSYGSTKHEFTDIDLRPEALRLPKKIYEEFLFLAAKYRIKPGIDFIPPQYSIGLIWHSHMQEPLNYENDCRYLIGYVLHHNPWPVIDEETMRIIHYIVDHMWAYEFQCQTVADLQSNLF